MNTAEFKNYFFNIIKIYDYKIKHQLNIGMFV
jgi:hypothetical protein